MPNADELAATMTERTDSPATLRRGQIEQWLEGARDPNGHPGWHPSTNGEIAALCELALKALPSAAAAEYAKRNPLGGPAKVFEAMAARIRAGEEYYSVLDDYGFQASSAPSERVRELNRAPSSTAAESAAMRAIEEHNAGCDAACDARRPNERQSGGCGYQKHDGSLVYSRPCPECPKDWKIELPVTPSAIERPSWHDVLLLRWCEWTGGHLSDKDFLKEVHDIVTDNLLQTTEQRPASTGRNDG